MYFILNKNDVMNFPVSITVPYCNAYVDKSDLTYSIEFIHMKCVCWCGLQKFHL